MEQFDGSTHTAQYVEDSGSSGIKANIGDDQVGFTSNQRSNDEESGRRDIARNKHPFCQKVGSSANSNNSRLNGDISAKLAECDLSMVARDHRLSNSRFA